MATVYIPPKTISTLGYEFIKKLAEDHGVMVRLTITHRNGDTVTNIIDKRSEPQRGEPK